MRELRRRLWWATHRPLFRLAALTWRLAYRLGSERLAALAARLWGIPSHVVVIELRKWLREEGRIS